MFTGVQFVALAVFAAVYAVRADLPANCARNYTVFLMDTCDKISANENVSTYQLPHVNPQIDAACDNLGEGEPLCLGITGQDCTTTYVIKDGDYCALIAEDNNVDLSTLLANNPNIDSECSNIYPGEVLCTATTVVPYTP
ncbi:LysM peptidoglycan-binding domain-containing protein [Phanerochaete sordida]|uniref:LysM peptidoglycan-binding domain-containing protein n=1 Tax=Phanerochaete sordida TaxID=48140 RepID=A0A9P3LK03_9APHY|nr:LysM peptidoglycan-binding domain-containing protein [Phanerochaete sordida]